MAKSSTNVNFKYKVTQRKKYVIWKCCKRSRNLQSLINWQIENGNRRLYYDLALKIANVFKLKPDELFYEYYK